MLVLASRWRSLFEVQSECCDYSPLLRHLPPQSFELCICLGLWRHFFKSHLVGDAVVPCVVDDGEKRLSEEFYSM